MSLKKKIKNNGLFLLTIIICLVILFPFIIFKNSLFVITNNSMNPTLQMGDLIIKSEKIPEDIKADDKYGDILILKGPQYFYSQGFDPIFWNYLENNSVIIHRAIDKKKINNTWYFLTKGDNNLAPDGAYNIIDVTNDSYHIQINLTGGIYISESEILGIVLFKIPYIGYLKIYFIHIVVLILVLFFMMVILRIFKIKIKIERIQL